MTEASGEARYRFGRFELDAATGELRDRTEPSRVASRLQPQPARLLVHLIRRRPQLVTRDEIRQLLWSDVEVEFEQGLHSCIRQIRSAIGDSAAEPQFVETIPRRGYRFLAQVDGDGPVDAGTTGEVPAAQVTGRTPAGRRTGMIAAGIVCVGLMILLAAAALRTGASPAPTRVAVMTFEPTSASSVFAPGNALAETLVERLTNDMDPAVEVIGPTTTSGYDGDGEGLRTLIDDYGIDFVINSRDTTGEQGARGLIEIIRATDGAHVWVAYLDELPPGSDVAAVIVQGLTDRMR